MGQADGDKVRTITRTWIDVGVFQYLVEFSVDECGSAGMTIMDPATNERHASVNFEFHDTLKECVVTVTDDDDYLPDCDHVVIDFAPDRS